MKIAGHREVYQLTSLKNFCGSMIDSRDPFFLLNTEVPDSDILAHEAGIPVIVRHEIGSGKIIFLAFDIRSSPFKQWQNREIFWNKILSLRPAVIRDRFDLPDQKIMTSAPLKRKSQSSQGTQKSA